LHIVYIIITPYMRAYWLDA